MMSHRDFRRPDERPVELVPGPVGLLGGLESDEGELPEDAVRAELERDVGHSSPRGLGGCAQFGLVQLLREVLDDEARGRHGDGGHVRVGAARAVW